MSAAHDTSACRRFAQWIHAYVDDELDAVHTLDVETHLAECDHCAEEVELIRATRNSLRKVACAKASSSLRERICAAMVAERQAEQEAARALPSLDDARSQASTDSAPPEPSIATAAGGSDGSRLKNLRFVMPLAAAATLALVIGAFQLQQQVAGEPDKVAQPSSMAAKSTFDRFLEELVAAHATPLFPEVTNFDDLQRFDPYVGVRVPRPKLRSVGADFKGARMHPRRAAMLRYLLRKRHRMTLYVFDPDKVDVSTNKLHPRRVGASRVYVGRVRGYAVAASEKSGIGYALASDLSADESARMLLMAAR